MGGLVGLIQLFFSLIQLAILIRVLLSWVRVSPYHPAVQLIYRLTDPILEPLRRYIPPIGMIDITPLVALLILGVIERVLLTILLSG